MNLINFGKKPGRRNRGLQRWQGTGGETRDDSAPVEGAAAKSLLTQRTHPIHSFVIEKLLDCDGSEVFDDLVEFPLLRSAENGPHFDASLAHLNFVQSSALSPELGVVDVGVFEAGELHHDLKISKPQL